MRFYNLELNSENKEKYRAFAKKLDENCIKVLRDIDKVFEANDIKDYNGYVYPSAVIMWMMKLDKDCIMNADEEELKIWLHMLENYKGEETFSQIIEDYCKEDEISTPTEEESVVEKFKNFHYKLAEEYWEKLNCQDLLGGDVGLKKELIDIIEEIGSFFALDEKLMEEAMLSKDMQYREALAKHISIWWQYKLDVYGVIRHEAFAIEIAVILMKYYSWLSDKANTETQLELLKNLYRHIMESSNGLRYTYEEFKISELFQGIIDGNLVIPEDYKFYEWVYVRVSHYGNGVDIEEEVQKTYRIDKWTAGTTWCHELSEEEIENIPNDKITLAQTVYDKAKELFETFKVYCKQAQEPIQNIGRHIRWEDDFAHEFGIEKETEGYASLALQRDYYIVKLINCGIIRHVDPSPIQERMKRGLAEWEEKIRADYESGVSTNVRRVLYAVLLTKAVLEKELESNQPMSLAKKEKMEELVSGMQKLSDEILETVYDRNGDAAKELLAVFR